MRIVHDQLEVRRLIDHIANALASQFAPDLPLNIVGIRTRGETLASRLAQALADRGFNRIGRGVLDVTLYRDDLSNIGPRPLVTPTMLEIQLDGNPCVLVDDVIFTGRSVRAALNLLNDFGRPKVVRLAVLVDRNGRELPIHPDFWGVRFLDVSEQDRVSVRLQETDGVDEIVVEPKK